MKRLAAVVLGVAFITSASGAAYAATSKSDMAMMKKCQSMSEDAMMKNKKCMAMMKKHPDMMGGNRGSGMSNSNMKR